MDALAAVIRVIERINEATGRATAWLTLTLVLNTFIVATLRYGFSIGWVWLQELYVWMHGTIIMVAAAYTLRHDGHVRVDIFYRGASLRYRAWVNLIGTACFLFPFLGLLAWTAVPYVALSWHRWETSREAGGMVGLYLWKSTMIIFIVLLALQGLALMLRSVLVLRGRTEWDPRPDTGLEGS